MTTQMPYQGYPYVNPTVTDVPTISADEAAKWRNLPRRPIDANWKRDPTQRHRVPDRDRKGSGPAVVYIDLPDDNGSAVSERLDSYDFEMVESPSSSAQYKRESDAPVVYIDMPEANGSDVALTPCTPEPSFIQDTIYYDQFENRRIDNAKEQTVDSEDDSEVSSPVAPQRRPQTLNVLQLNGAGPSTALSVPPLMSKETEVYGSSSIFSTIPASQFPEPPPAYEEVQSTPVVEQPRPVASADPPRTQVILPGDPQPQPTMHAYSQPPIGLPDSQRKFLTCQHCGMRVHTMVIRENEMITHVVAFTFLLLCLWPIAILIYCTDILKPKNHYCPNCNQCIGYQRPPCGRKIYYKSGHSVQST